MDIQNEIEALETASVNLACAIEDIKDTPYHKYLAEAWEHDAEEIQERLKELYAMQDEQWQKELQYQNYEYEREVGL